MSFQAGSEHVMNSLNPFYQRYGAWAVVTGASEGIGAAFARELAASKFHLVLVARRQSLLDSLATELTDLYGIQVHIIATDLSTAKGTSSVIDACAELDIGLLVQAAGFGTSGSFIANTLEDERGLIALNCASVLELAWHFARRFAAQKRGGMIFLSSVVAFHGVPRQANYAASKAYVQSLAEGLHVELKPLGVDVLSVAPGPITSGFAGRSGLDVGNAPAPSIVAKAALHCLGKQTTVRPGFLSKLLGYSLNLLPRWGRILVMTQIMKGMTKNRP